MRVLERTKNSGWQGYQLLKGWLRRWGPSTADESVLLRIARYAIRDGRDDIAYVMHERARIAATSSGPRDSSEMREGGSNCTFRQQMRHVYPRRGHRLRTWRSIATICAKAQNNRAGIDETDFERTQKSIAKMLRKLENASVSWRGNAI